MIYMVFHQHCVVLALSQPLAPLIFMSKPLRSPAVGVGNDIEKKTKSVREVVRGLQRSKTLNKQLPQRGQHERSIQRGWFQLSVDPGSSG